MPFTMSKLTWYSHEDVLLQAHEDVMHKMLESNREEARRIALRGDGVEYSDTAIGEILVSFDGNWSRRGFSANPGISVLISASTGKVLDYECLSKICNMCTQKKATMSKEEFEAWQDQHACDGNFGGSSPSMELEVKAKHDVMVKAGISVGTFTKKASKKRDSERVSQAEKRIQGQHKKYRLARSQARKRDENMRLNKEGKNIRGWGL